LRKGKEVILLLDKRISVLLFVSLVLLSLYPALASALKIVRGIYIDDIEPPEGSPGTKVYVYGGGATPNGTVEALLSDEEIVVINQTVVVIGNMSLGWTIADAEGYWEIIFVVPEVAPGNYTVFAVDNETRTVDAIGFFVLPAYVGIRIEHVSPQSGPPGTVVYLSGSGATTRGQVRIYFDETNVANTTAKDWGWWSVSFTVPPVEPGEYTITALDVISNTTDIASFTVTPPPTIHVSPSEASIGSKITISGEGFPSGTGLFLTLEDFVLFSPITTDERGEFNVTLFVPMVNSGDYTVKAITTYPYPVKAVANTSFTVTLGVDDLLSSIPQGLLKEKPKAQNQADADYDPVKAESDSANSIYDHLQSALDATRDLNPVLTVIAMILVATAAYLLRPKAESQKDRGFKSGEDAQKTRITL